MKFLALIAGAIAVLSAPLTELQRQSQFAEFINKFNKKYDADEFLDRYNVYKTNAKLVEDHNAKTHTYTLAMNEFGDLTFAEFRAKYLGFAGVDTSRRLDLHVAPKNQVLADSIDWSERGAVTPVKNQAQCGSCWAFSTTGAVEGATQVKTGKLVSLSEQQLVDCAGAEGNQGCNGGLMDNGFQYIIANGGLDTEGDYSYTARDGTCNTSKQNKKNSPISSFKDVAVGSETALLSAVNLNPVAIAIEADQSGFQFYSGGVFSGDCGTQLDHGVLLVGYGTDSSQQYWKVKNSWGSSWGENGYIRLIRGQNQCGLANAASYPIV